MACCKTVVSSYPTSRPTKSAFALFTSYRPSVVISAAAIKHRSIPGFISGLVPGVYEISTELDGSKKFTRKDVRLEIGKTATVDVTLQVGQDMNMAINEGPTDFDRRHNLVISRRALVPYTHGMTFSWVAQVLTGLPFTLLNNDVNADRNGTLFDPIARGYYSGAGVSDNRHFAP